ncbi:MAG: hypothetical protein HY897_05205, partial [Deltaproteobacteria bacterium]|nr:hypothetical protein [Deltaproteobacteria bacterium]
FCTPASRNDRVEGEANADTFYGLQHDILFSVGPGAYGSTQPKSIADLNSEEYPANEQTYREYIQYLVQQYPDVIYWEMGNEANYSAFWGDTPENYARFVTLSSTEIKNLCPGCKVGISLTNPDPGASWFNAITGVCDDIDFLDLHHYQSSTMSELALFETSSLTAWKASCPGKEIISTETGLPSVPVTFKGETWQLGKNETEQGQDIIKYFTMMFNAGYGKIYNYLIDHDFVAGEADIFESIGVLRMDGTKKVSFTTYLVMISKLDHFVSVARLSAGQYKYTFTHKNPVFVLWCDSGSCALTSEVSGTVKITDYLGNEQTMSSGQIVLTRSPVFVEGN